MYCDIDVQQDHQRNQNRQTMNRNHNQGPQGSHHNQQGNQQRGGWTSRGPMRQRGRPRGGFKPNQGQPTQGNKAKNTLKFENDYDFEQANTEFEELRSQLAKVKIEETSKTEVNGDIDKKDDSGNETGAGENEPEEEHEVFYDKSKSFFDKISCEAVERAKGKSQRTDWRTERKLNSETFGVAATRRGKYVELYS
jgi:protein LSM14